MVRMTVLSCLLCLLNIGYDSTVDVSDKSCKDTLYLENGQTRVITFLSETRKTVVFEDCHDYYVIKSEIKKNEVLKIKLGNGELIWFNEYEMIRFVDKKLDSLGINDNIESEVDESSNIDAIYLRSEMIVQGEFDYQTGSAIFLYDPETGKRTKVKKREAHKWVKSSGEVKYFKEQSKGMIALKIIGISIGAIFGTALLGFGALLLILFN